MGNVKSLALPFDGSLPSTQLGLDSPSTRGWEIKEAFQTDDCLLWRRITHSQPPQHRDGKHWCFSPHPPIDDSPNPVASTVCVGCGILGGEVPKRECFPSLPQLYSCYLLCHPGPAIRTCISSSYLKLSRADKEKGVEWRLKEPGRFMVNVQLWFTLFLNMAGKWWVKKFRHKDEQSLNNRKLYAPPSPDLFCGLFLTQPWLSTVGTPCQGIMCSWKLSTALTGKQ